ncbi:GPI-linked NAD(P)(+)--arginine ADP-ribosyltransferase 1-like [Sardina pilchardus]|uniref:GPI-linked NAD(P)(+)--arginine ADP-ribosyltransferase 1-like n=1 Tax=Sardina pilchardus TaxID=27697 RepID=UPI002E13B2FA
MAMMASPAVILLFSAGLALGQDERVAVNGKEYPLDMAFNSADDQYEGCAKNMANFVEAIFLKRELRNNDEFGDAWREVEQAHYCDNPGHGLTRNHCIALFMYTGTGVYYSFNSAVRNGKEKYNSLTFEWYSLQFFITEALQILQGKTTCRWTYRGTRLEFDKDIKHKEIRLGAFTSSSLNHSIAQAFGNTSCFTTYTCYGVYIAQYSPFDEEEVLIPPYETFVVIDVLSRASDPDLWCDTVYVLNSTGTRSDLNCAVVTLPFFSITKSHVGLLKLGFS